MKKLYILFLLLAVVGCTNNNSSTTQNPSPAGDQTEDQGSVVFDISNLEIDGFVVSPDPIALGDTTNEEKTATLTVKNSNSSSQSITVGQLTQAGFKIKINRCSSAIAAGKSCQITVAFSPRDLFTGSYNDSLVINTGSIPITASVSGRPDPDVSGSPNIKLSLNAPFEPVGASPLRVLTIKNEGTGTAQNVSTAIPSSYTVWTNRCSSNLKPGKSCEVQVVLKNARQLPPVADQSAIVSSSNQVDPVSLNLKEGASFVKADVSGVSVSVDNKTISITGSNLTRAVSVALYKADGTTLISTMNIVSKQSNLLVVEPTQDLVLQDTEIVLRIL